MHCVRTYVSSLGGVKGKVLCHDLDWCGALWVMARGGGGYKRGSQGGLALFCLLVSSPGGEGVCVRAQRREDLLRDTWWGRHVGVKVSGVLVSCERGWVWCCGERGFV